MPASELRHDVLSGRLAIVAAGRAARPHTVERQAAEQDAGPEHCPFCPGHESMTPPEITRTGDGAPGTPGWRVRVVPNLYPIVGTDGTDGAHEVVVLSPDHHRSFGALDDDEAIEATTVVRDRVATTSVRRATSTRSALVNHRRAAGASIAHPHAQVVALDFVPPEVLAAEQRRRGGVRRPARARPRVRSRSRCGAHRRVGVGVVPVRLRVSVSRCASAIRRRAGVSTRRPTVSSPGSRSHCRDALARLAEIVGDPPYNVALHTAAADGTGPRRWYAEITPRLTVVAGFEQATGVLVNTTPAEHAATLLRSGRR